MSKSLAWSLKVACLQAKHAIALAKKWDTKTDWSAREKQLDEDYERAIQNLIRRNRISGSPAQLALPAQVELKPQKEALEMESSDDEPQDAMEYLKKEKPDLFKQE